MAISTCQLEVDTTLPLVCICTLLSFLCGVGIGANDLSANFAMVVGSGSLNMRQAIIYCTVFELLGAAFMGGHVSSTIRNGIVDGALFARNKDVVVVGMTCATFAAALWLYLSTVFGLPVSITHTVVGSILGFAIFASGGFTYVKSSGLVVIVISWLAAPLVACAVTALIFYYMRRDIFKKKGRSFERALKVLPYCLFSSLLVDFFFVLIEAPPIMSLTFAAYVPLAAQYLILLAFIFLFCWLATVFAFPQVAEAAQEARSFVWESEALRTEPVEPAASRRKSEELKNLSFFKPKHDSGAEGVPPKRCTSGLSNATTRSATPAPAPPPSSSSALPEPHDLLATSSVSMEVVPTSEAAVHIQDPHPRAGSNLATEASLVLSSIVASDNPVVHKGGAVRLAPVRTSRTLSPAPHTQLSGSNFACVSSVPMSEVSYLPGHNVEASNQEERETWPLHTAAVDDYGSTNNTNVSKSSYREAEMVDPRTPASVHSEDEFGEDDWDMDHPMQPIRFGGILIKPFNPRAEYLFTGLQVVAGSMSSFVHGAVAGANATATFVILYDAFTDHELETPGLSSRWSVLPAMLGIAIGMFGLGASLMKTVGMELVTVTPARGWCIQTGGTLVTMILTGIGIPVSLSQSQIGAAIGCGVLDAKLGGVSWGIVTKVVTGWVVTLIISALTTGVSMWVVSALLCA
ncbi:putative phosphate transporter [Leptomonas pyrrhocoris]|uniref:Phosphate transporter n=1 Tax=Leptomonas pyrrhocoris TaxID=157538 RepID=A0A0M9G1P2_LEPPY|nr:putative phosphate transporter [Leptomonas pyrrhocoris]KPA80377.1 putative phosphate transporter [Leptomonas pyrrhocoris]|eukprot:XP_015658816.1 putative phosphate transporter [Leptomonas pyrrhocoris]